MSYKTKTERKQCQGEIILHTYNIFLLSDAPKCSYKGPQRIYGAIGEKILLVCDVTPFPQGRNLKFQWNFQEGGSTKSNKVLRTNQGFQY